MAFRIREVDASDELTAEILKDLHEQTFLDHAKLPSFEEGHWWLCHQDTEPVGFAGVVKSPLIPSAGYFIRVGVVQKHLGNRLQLRFMRALERKALYNGWTQIISDTTDNVASANNFIRANYRLFEPPWRWAFPHSLYWRKAL